MQKKGAIAVADLIGQLCDSPMYSEKYICLLQYPAVGGNDHHLYGQ